MRISYTILTSILSLFAANAMANPQIRVVGSSTVYPLVTVAAESFARTSTFKAPIVESTGTGGGFKLFCAGAGSGFPDLQNASRPITDSEKTLCKQNKVGEITEIKIGYDGITLSNSVKAPKYNLTKKDIFLALASKVPSNGKLIPNPYKTWNQVNKSLPKTKIEVYGPPPTSGTRDAFAELVMESTCKTLPEFAKTYPDESARKGACLSIREDGHYIEAGENDNLIVQKLESNTNSLGIFGFSSLEENSDAIQASNVDGIEPSFENILSGTYTISRPLFVYFKDAHLKQTDGLKEFIKELTSTKALGEEGYLSFKGLVPMSEDELAKLQTLVNDKLK